MSSIAGCGPCARRRAARRATPGPRRCRRGRPLGQPRDARAVEVACVGQPVALDRGTGEPVEPGVVERARRGGGGEHDVGALDAAGVRVDPRGEPAVDAHRREHEVEGAACDPRVGGSSSHLRRPHVGRREQRLVAQHLLEVRDGPRGVDAVAREAAGDVVEEPAPCHRVQRDRRHPAGRRPDRSRPTRRARRRATSRAGTSGQGRSRRRAGRTSRPARRRGARAAHGPRARRRAPPGGR